MNAFERFFWFQHTVYSRLKMAEVSQGKADEGGGDRDSTLKVIRAWTIWRQWFEGDYGGVIYKPLLD